MPCFLLAAAGRPNPGQLFIHLSSYLHHIACVLGAGDRAEHVLWRMQNGELPTDAKPKVVEVMIGANDVLKANRTLLKVWHSTVSTLTA